ncbi:hypothetical protein [Candidatus Ichthyocystis hellenicum]|uniref:hypothetical protein n=1 Tax=Candidatus Ichthyocystis hellenicum TaxID=1561003 RepID=UPI0011123C54|nr:hypothetical protein [Candidatus Ichthyocystis hellenicum]
MKKGAFFKVVSGFTLVASVVFSAFGAFAASGGDSCDKAVFSAVDPRNRLYYLTASPFDFRIFLTTRHRRSLAPLSSSQLWELRQTYPVPTDKDPSQPAWVNVFLLFDDSPAFKERKFHNLFMYLSDESPEGSRSLILYPALLGYYAVSGARVDFESANESMSRMHLVLRESKMYVVPNWYSSKGGIVSVSLESSPGDFPGWSVSSERDYSSGGKPGDCTRYLIKKYGIHG